MATRQTVRTKVTIRRKKTGGTTGYVKCNMCHGTGRVKKGKRK